MNLRVERAFRYEGTFPEYKLPFEIGCFSIDAEGKYQDDGREMKYISMPDKLDDLHMDLNEGFHEYIDIVEDSDYNSKMLLKWILSHEDLIEKHFMDKVFSSLALDFVCDRGVLTRISSTPCERSEDWMIYATKFRSVIYLVEIKTDKKSDREENATEKEIRMSSWGFKFEQYMVSDSMDSEPDTSVPVNENEKYFAVFKGKLQQHRLLFYAECDGVDPKEFVASGYDKTSPLRYVELKTSRIITSDRQDRNFRKYKLIKWYLQSYLGGTPRVICGFRDDEGIVRKLETFDVKDMPELAGQIWSPAACLSFTSEFLDFVKECVSKDKIVYKFYWKPGSDVTCEEKDADYRYMYLPEWYTSKVKVL